MLLKLLRSVACSCNCVSEIISLILLLLLPNASISLLTALYRLRRSGSSSWWRSSRTWLPVWLPHVCGEELSEWWPSSWRRSKSLQWNCESSDSMGRQLDILIYFHLKKQTIFFPFCETDKAQRLEFLVFYSGQIEFWCSNRCWNSLIWKTSILFWVVSTNRCHVQFQLEEGTNEDLLRSVRGIKRAFRKITSYTLPYPGPTIAGASENKKEWRLTG